MEHLARKVSNWTGSTKAIVLSCCIILVWGMSGPFLGFSDVWMLLINTLTTIITFVMVFFIQNAQHVNERALHIKLDELILSLQDTHNDVAGIEERTEKEIEEIHHRHIH